MNRQAVWTLVVVSTASFMAGLDNLVVTTALPAIRADLGGALADLEWTVSAYTLTFAVLLMFGAALGDRFGRRRLFLGGLTVFTLGSAAAALAPSMGTLIAARAVQGAGAAVMMPLTLTLLTVAVPAARRGMAFGIWSGVSGLAVATGPLIGGSLTEHFSWQWIFWVNVPVGLLLLPLARTVLGESRGENPRLDLPGTALVSAGLFGVVLGLVRGNPDGWTDPLVLTALIGGTLLLAAFVGYEIRYAKRPMLPMRLFRNRTFSAVNAASLLMFLGMFGSIFLISQYFQGVNGYTAEQAGVRMLPWTAMPLLVSPLAGIFTDRIGGRPIVVAGLVLQALGLVGMALLAENSAGYGAQVPVLMVCGTGMALYFAPTANLVMASVRPTEQGIASGANNAMREVGGALGVAVLSAVFSAQGGYDSVDAFTDGLVPAVLVGALAIGAGAVAVAFVPRRRGTRDRVAAAESVPA
ncbi:DHA2 family efflux MFS transporter permease subunit [Kitasatospora sp. NPDC057198]|uniref:DHA2 family efflux MFS transporter permease subunit n=1 Tax=Kitasatospora sp. NPDC057198 TaxID=3346046 RepID=UPI00362C5256